MKQLTCIVCPRGCQLNIDDNNVVTGNFCPRGKNYAISEITNPTRIVTSTMKVLNSNEVRVPVKTSKPIKKGLMFEIMDKINSKLVYAPIKIGDVLIENVDGDNTDIIATKNIDVK